MDCSLPCCSVHGILQARRLEWVAIPFSRASSQLRIESGSPTLQADLYCQRHQGHPQGGILRYKLNKRHLSCPDKEKTLWEEQAWSAWNANEQAEARRSAIWSTVLSEQGRVLALSGSGFLAPKWYSSGRSANCRHTRRATIWPGRCRGDLGTWTWRLPLATRSVFASKWSLCWALSSFSKSFVHQSSKCLC